MSAREGYLDALEWVTETLASAESLRFATPGEAPASALPGEILREAGPLLSVVGDFESIGYAAVDEDGVGFRVVFADPPERSDDIEAELQAQVASGMFAWSLYQRRSVVIAGERLGRWVVLHVVATPSRVLGMFVASHRDASAFQSAISQQLLSVVLARVATALETTLLYRELAAYNARLEALVEERTRELRRSEEEARAASRAKSDFLANISHEIRTPIHGIMGFTRLLLEAGLGREAHEHAEIVLRSAESLLTIVNDLLDYAKVEAGRLELERAPFDLRHAVEDVVELVAPRVAGRPVELVLDFAVGAPRHVVGDVGRIRQVVLNLVANAARFTSRGHIFVTVRPAREGGVAISVEDTGVGIPPDKIEAMFEKFTQGGVGSRTQGGTGLGLSIARTLARRMDGDVTAVSVPGSGSTFTFTLPFVEEIPRAGPSDRPLAGSRVLVITRSRLLAEGLAGTLEGQGAEVAAASGESVLTALRGAETAGPVRAILVDGAVGATEFRALPWLVRAAYPGAPAPPLWALLESHAQGAWEALREAGYSGWIQKPVRESRLLAAVCPTVPAATAAPQRTGPGFKGARVLIADDDDISLRLGVFLLERMGCQVTGVDDGLKVLEATERENFDLVLLDGAMPGLDGYRTASALRKRAGRRSLPIIALTASATPEDRRRALEAGMDDHIAKPVTPAGLAQALSLWLEATPPPREEPSSSPSPADHDLDVAEALRRVGGDRRFLEAQLQLFLETWPELRQRMLEACGRGDAAELRVLSHRLKGSAGSLAARNVHRLAGALESSSAWGYVNRGREALDGLDGAVDRVRERVEALRSDGAAA
jgi:signal transduction histidine kinase/DNA-binding response OmpR family regulator